MSFIFKTSLNLPFFFGTLTEYVLCFNENASSMLFLPISTTWACRFMPTRRPRFRNIIKSPFVYRTYTDEDDFGLITNCLIWITDVLLIRVETYRYMWCMSVTPVSPPTNLWYRRLVLWHGMSCSNAAIDASVGHIPQHQQRDSGVGAIVCDTTSTVRQQSAHWPMVQTTCTLA